MKKICIAVAAALVATAVFAQGPGRRVYKPGDSVPQSREFVKPELKVHFSSDLRANPGHPHGGDHLNLTPIALTFGPFGMPYGRNWGITGLRINVGFPGFTKPYEAVYGFDVGLSGETYSEAGGVLANALNNEGRDVYGLSVAGLWNVAHGTDSAAAQISAVYNSAEGLQGLQIGLVNRAHELHGFQLGIYNIAVCGTGFQVGLWNDMGNGAGSPLLGIVY